MPGDGSQDGSGGGEYENANAAAKHADASHRFRISHSFEASPRSSMVTTAARSLFGDPEGFATLAAEQSDVYEAMPTYSARSYERADTRLGATAYPASWAGPVVASS
jgi:hypothetical protein